jgi:hypothetical protein
MLLLQHRILSHCAFLCPTSVVLSVDAHVQDRVLELSNSCLNCFSNLAFLYPD